MGFLDGAKVLKVRMYEGALETWKEWGRSLDLKDASSRAQVWGDLWLLSAVQGLPILVLLSYLLLPSLVLSLPAAAVVRIEYIFGGDSLCFIISDRSLL